MKAVIGLELIGDNHFQRRRLIEKGEAPQPHLRRWLEILEFTKRELRPWVARITGTHSKYGLARKFLRGQKDYSQANSIGSRGVYEYFVLDPGIYEINERCTWKRARRYFVHVDGAEFHEIDKEEVLECLRSDI
jgi:hypothetical protein